MIYSKIISVPISRPLTNPGKCSFRITKGLIYKIELQFPCGSAGLMGVAIFDSAYSVWPSNIGEFFTGDDIVISFDDLYLKEQPPYHFDIYAYNLDDTYKHRFSVRIGLVSKEAYQARFLPNKSWEYFADMLKGLEREKEIRAIAQRTKIIEAPFEWIKGS